MAMENGPFIDDFPIKTSIYKGFSIAMLNNQRVSFFTFFSLDIYICFMEIPLSTFASSRPELDFFDGAEWKLKFPEIRFLENFSPCWLFTTVQPWFFTMDGQFRWNLSGYRLCSSECGRYEAQRLCRDGPGGDKTQTAPPNLCRIW